MGSGVLVGSLVPGYGVCGVISWSLAIEGIGGVVRCVRSRVLGWVGG